MKIRAALISLAFIFSSASAAQAIQVDFAGHDADNMVNMGNLAYGQYGNLYDWYGTNSSNSSSTQTGYIPSKSTLTFTFTGYNLPDNIEGFGSFNTMYGDNANGGYFRIATDLSIENYGYNNYYPVIGASLAIIQAGIVGNSFVVKLFNNSNEQASFNFFERVILGNSGTLSASYNVSSIPLPASLPMFAAVIFALLGFAHFRKQTTLV